MSDRCCGTCVSWRVPEHTRLDRRRECVLLGQLKRRDSGKQCPAWRWWNDKEAKA